MKNYKIKTSFVSLKGENWFQFNNFYFGLRGKLSVIHALHFPSLSLRTGSNPAEINWFRSHTGNVVNT